MTIPITANATFCATLVDEWVAAGLTAAFIAPGSRSTPLALALSERTEIEIHVVHDERVAGFAALGRGLATGVPAVVLCSSGTAGTHFHGAVVEADLSAVPMLVCTADRPPELWGRGAPQTIDQTDLYGDVVRGFAEPGPPDDTDPATWRPLAAETYAAATGSRPGPVHLNLSFRDPLTGTAGELPPPIATLTTPPAVTAGSDEIDALAAMLVDDDRVARRGVIVAGRGQSQPSAVLTLADRLGWPVIADHRSGCRVPGRPARFDTLLRDQTFAAARRPAVMLRLGEIVASKAVSQWIEASAAAGTTVIASRPFGRLIDPEQVATSTPHEARLIPMLLDRLPAEVTPSDEATIWAAADDSAEATIADVLAAVESVTEPEVARAVLGAVPAGGALVVSSSMPVRDIEWFGPNRGDDTGSDIDVFANRGANGIDGIISTAIGVASSGRPTICLIGDVAFLHDSTALVALARRSLDLTIVVTDNDGGAIFSFLPQHELLEKERYEQLFGTPHGTNLAALARAHDLTVRSWDAAMSSPAGVTPDGITVVIAKTDRTTNLALHHRLGGLGPELAAGDGHQVHFVGAVGDAERPQARIHPG